MYIKVAFYLAVYHPPNAHTEAPDNIVAMLDRVEHENKEVVLMGDLNCVLFDQCKLLNRSQELTSEY